MHTNQPRLTLTLSKVCLELLCPVHSSRCLPNCISFLSPNPPVSEGRVPEPGSRCTHCRPHQSAPKASSRLLRHCQAAAAGTCHRDWSAPGSAPSLHSWERRNQQCLVLGHMQNLTQRP